MCISKEDTADANSDSILADRAVLSFTFVSRAYQRVISVTLQHINTNTAMTKDRDNKEKRTNQEPHKEAFRDGWLDIDPERIRFQHSRIRPFFSGCGRGVVDTLDEIRQGKLSPSDLPPIQVLVGLDENDGKGPWYFSLNNRRLWVLKRCREEGLLSNNLIRVRVRKPKSANEIERYTLDKCSLDAKLIREKSGNKRIVATSMRIETGGDSEQSSSIEESEDESVTDDHRIHRNPFLLRQGSSSSTDENSD